MGRLPALVGAFILFACAVFASGALGAFPADPPNDPAYNPAEQGGPETCAQKAGDNQQHYLFSFIPKCTPNATDPEGSAGMSVDRAWREFTTGNPQTTIAYVEGGINWRNDPEELANKVYLNAKELPPPTTPVNDGALAANDYSDSPDTNGNGLVDPEDLIVRYSDGKDQDHNGYTDDISGWDFYNNQNDPATLDSQYDHANFQMRQAGSQTNNGTGEAGVCPDCRIMPIKAGAEALDRTDDLAEAWMYAADMNVDVVVSTTADLGYSTFMEDAVEYAWRKGTVMVEASNDFNSTDHQGGMFHNHVLPGNGMIANTAGLTTVPGPPGVAASNAMTTTYRQRSAYTSWGTHNMFTAATTGGTTSESTPTVGGVVGLVRAYSKELAAKGTIKRRLSPSEVIQVLRATSSDVTADPNPPLGWPAKPGWDLQFGYGRPNVYKAMAATAAGDIPPEAWMTSPRWFSLYDPMKTKKVRVSGHVGAPRSKRLRYVLQFAPGPEPEDSEFMTAGKGAAKGKKARKGITGQLGTINLSKVPKAFWSRAFTLSAGKTLETNEAYTVTIRLRVYDAKGRMAEERRAIAVHHDPTLRKGFPLKIGPGGESQPVFADLQGRGREAIIFGDADGRVHAVNDRGRELPGFPAFARKTKVTKKHKGVRPGHEPIFTNVAVGDLDHNGRQSIVATSSTGRTYVWDSRGHLRKGWPRTLNTGAPKPAIPRPDSPFTRPAITGASAPPVLVDLDGDKKLDIVQAGWDGHLHAWKANGRSVKGWPVHVTLPPGTTPPAGMVQINDQKLDVPPAVAELDGDPQPELIQRTQYSFTTGAGLQVPNGGVSNIVAYNNDGTRVPGFSLAGTGLAFYYGSAQEFITEGVQNPTTADVDGDGKTEIASAAGIFSPTSLYNPDGSSKTTYAPLPGAAFAAFAPGPNQLASLTSILNGNLPDDAPVNFTTSGAFGKIGGGALAYAEPGSGAATAAGSLLLPGSGLPINNYARAVGAADGQPIPGYPAKMQGLDFLGAPAIADVSGDGKPDLIIGGDSSALHAFNGGGQAKDFPKFTTGWVVFGPAVGDVDGNGKNELAVTTREGYLMVWDTDGLADGNDEWWGYRHDERNTGSYGIDTRPPGVARKPALRGDKLTFIAPGDDWYSGQAKSYVLRLGPGKKAKHVKLNAGLPAGEKVTVKVPAGVPLVRIQALDEAGNVGGTRIVAAAQNR